jgi:hypothetical protein
MAVGLSVSALPAAAETINCTAITALPATISGGGVYCLTGNLVTSAATGAAITISSPNVTLDLNGWRLAGLGAGLGTQTIGIVSSAANVTIRNGIVRGFKTGISLDGASNLVEGVLADQNRVSGINTAGVGTILRKNVISGTGGGTAGDNQVFGIYCTGHESRVIDNDVTQTVRSGVAQPAQEAFGIALVSSGAVVENNRVTSSQDYGIFSSASLEVVVMNNRILNYASPGQIGLRTNSGSSLRRDNVVGGFATPYLNGIDGGNNQSMP